MAIKTLISPNEVIRKAHVDHNFDPNLICSHITKAEYRFLEDDKGCFGSDFYAALLADAVDFVDYDSTVTYAINTIVIYDGKYYKCLANGTINIVPTNTGSWVKVNKFATAAYQTLWEDFLWEYLSIAVQHTSTFKSAYRSTNQGIMRNETQSSKPAEFAGVKALKDELLDDVRVLEARMDKFLRANATDYPLYKGNLESCGDNSCKKSSSSSIGLYLKKGSNSSGTKSTQSPVVIEKGTVVPITFQCVAGLMAYSLPDVGSKIPYQLFVGQNMVDYNDWTWNSTTKVLTFAFDFGENKFCVLNTKTQ